MPCRWSARRCASSSTTSTRARAPCVAQHISRLTSQSRHSRSTRPSLVPLIKASVDGSIAIGKHESPPQHRYTHTSTHTPRAARRHSGGRPVRAHDQSGDASGSGGDVSEARRFPIAEPMRPSMPSAGGAASGTSVREAAAPDAAAGVRGATAPCEPGVVAASILSRWRTTARSSSFAPSLADAAGCGGGGLPHPLA